MNKSDTSVLAAQLADRDQLIEDLKRTLTDRSSPTNPQPAAAISTPSLNSLSLKDAEDQLQLLREEKQSLERYIIKQSENLNSFKQCCQKYQFTVLEMEERLNGLESQLTTNRSTIERLQTDDRLTAERRQTDQIIIDGLEDAMRQLRWECETRITELEAAQTTKLLQITKQHSVDCGLLSEQHQSFLNRLEEILCVESRQDDAAGNIAGRERVIIDRLIKMDKELIGERQRSCDLQSMVDSHKVIAVKNRNQISNLVNQLEQKVTTNDALDQYRQSNEQLAAELERSRRSNAELDNRFHAIQQQNQHLQQENDKLMADMEKMRSLATQLHAQNSEQDRRFALLHQQQHQHQQQREQDRLAFDTTVELLSGKLQRQRNKYHLLKARYKQLIICNNTNVSMTCNNEDENTVDSETDIIRTINDFENWSPWNFTV